MIMAAHRVSDTRVMGANYEAHYPLIRGQFVKQIKAVCDIDCQNNQHSFQLLFFLLKFAEKSILPAYQLCRACV